MKKLFLSLVAVIVAATTMDAQDVYVATLNHDETITEYYGSTAFQSAYYAAVDGDIITLSDSTLFHLAKNALSATIYNKEMARTLLTVMPITMMTLCKKPAIFCGTTHFTQATTLHTLLWGKRTLPL